MDDHILNKNISSDHLDQAYKDNLYFQSILYLLLRGDSKNADVETPEAFFSKLINSNHADDFGMTRQVPLAPLTERETLVYGSNSYPIIVRNESQSSNISGTLNGWLGAAKYGYLFIRQGSMDELENMQGSDGDPDLLAVHYESPADPQGPYNAPWAQRGTGGIFSHGQLFLKLDNVTTGGDIENAPTTYNQADFPLWMGHVVPTVPVTLKNNEVALSDTNQITYELDENINASWFLADNPQGNGGGSAFVWTPNPKQTPNDPDPTFADEASDPLTGFTNAERVRIRSVDAVNNTITVSRVNVPNGSNVFGSSAPDGASFRRLKGDRLMMVLPGQGSFKALNDGMNMHPNYGFEDANGNTYLEVMKNFYRGNLNRDAKGIARNVTIDVSASDVTEEHHPNTSRYRIDFDGDGVRDGGYVENINRWKEAHELGTATYTGLTHGGGGTGEAVLKNMEFQQIEHVSESGQFAVDQEQTFYDMGGYILRALYHKFYASHAHYNACVTKHSTLAFNGTKATETQPTSNDAFYTKMGLCLLALTNIAPQNFNVASNIELRDNWWVIGAVNLRNGSDSGTPNRPSNQTQIKRDRGWGGSPISSLQNISDTDFDSLTPDYEWDFSTNVTGDWSLDTSNNIGNSQIVYDDINKRMVVRNITKSFSVSNLILSTKNSILENSDIGDDVIVRYHIGANTHGEIQQQLGDNTTIAERHRTIKDIYLNPDQEIKYDTALTITSADTATPARGRLRLALPRLNDSDTLNSEFYVYKVQVYKGKNIDNSVWVREFEHMVSICNGTNVSKTIPISAGKTLKFPIITPATLAISNQLPSWAESGEVFDMNNPLVLPATSCGILIKKT